MKVQLKNQAAIISKLREQLEHRVKRVIELKAELAKERDLNGMKRRHMEFQTSISRLEKEFNE